MRTGLFVSIFCFVYFASDESLNRTNFIVKKSQFEFSFQVKIMWRGSAVYYRMLLRTIVKEFIWCCQSSEVITNSNRKQPWGHADTCVFNGKPVRDMGTAFTKTWYEKR